MTTYGTAKFTRDVDYGEGITFTATVEVSGKVIRDGTEGIGWSPRVSWRDDPHLVEFTGYVYGDHLPKTLERLFVEHCHDEICECVLKQVGDIDIDAAILDAAQ